MSDWVGDVSQILFDVTTDTNGVAQNTTASVHNGIVIGAYIVNGTGGDQPTTGYDITITDANGQDVLNGKGRDLVSTVNKVITAADLGGGIPIMNSTLTIDVSNAGDTNKCKVFLKKI